MGTGVGHTGVGASEPIGTKIKKLIPGAWSAGGAVMLLR
jgi:hypothetical protein